MRIDKMAAVLFSSLSLACTGVQAADGSTQIKVLDTGTSTIANVRKILFLGNSITLHPPYEAIGWSNNWGMAASAEAKDYVHLVTDAIAQRAGVTPEIMVRNIADFERNYATYDVETLLADAFAFKPDLFVLAIGENVTLADATQFKAGVLRIINGVWAQNSQALVVVRSCFWADAAKDLALSQAAQQAGVLFVDIGAFGAVEANLARSEPTFSDPAFNTFNSHPGDRGMAAIATAIVQAVVAQEAGVVATLSDMLVDSHRTEPLTVTEDSAIGTVINAGRIVKDGDASLVVTNALLVHGTEEVKAGTLELGNGVSDLPAALQSGLAFWVDANRNVATDESGTVTNWYDVREAVGGTSYPRARQFGSEPAPTLVTGGDDVAENKLVDFGAFASGKWLQWQDSAGNQYRMGNIRTVFLAVSCTNGTGFMLGDATGYPTEATVFT